MDKQEFIEKIRFIAFRDLGDYIKTDIDDDLEDLLDEDYEKYNEARSKGNIIRFDFIFLVWLNGIIYAFNCLSQDNDEVEDISRDDIITNFDQVFDVSRLLS